MAKHLLMLTSVTFVLLYGGVPARAQEDSDDPAVMQHSEEAQQNQGDEEGTRMMGHSMMRRCMRQCMSGDRMMGRDTVRHGGMRGGFAMGIIFALMDPDGDGTISLEEFQAAHERIFKAIDTDKDGTVSMEEMRDFLHGAGKATLPQRSAPKD